MSEFEIPKECKGAVVVNEGPDFHVEIQMVPVPDIGPEDVLIKMNVTGLCMSDVHFMTNDWKLAPMSHFGTRCAGHEGAGVIVKVGERVKRLKVGQRAGFKPVAETCGSCTYKQYLRSPESYTTLIPDGVSDVIAGPIMCSASTMYTSLRESELAAGDWAVFPGGGGGVGIQGVQLASAMGIRPVVIDTGDEKKKIALQYGAEHFLDFEESKDLAGEVIAICDGVGAHGVFVTAGQSYPIALSYLGTRVGGKVMCIALPSAGQYPITVSGAEMVMRNRSIKGTMVSSRADVNKTLEFAQRGKLRLEPEVVGLSRFNESVQRLKAGKVAGRIVVDFNQD